jgi:hypothetical protein
MVFDALSHEIGHAFKEFVVLSLSARHQYAPLSAHLRALVPHALLAVTQAVPFGVHASEKETMLPALL